MTSADIVDGEGGNDTVHLEGDYSGEAVKFLAPPSRVSRPLQLEGAFSYDLTFDYDTVEDGQTMSVVNVGSGTSSIDASLVVSGEAFR